MTKRHPVFWLFTTFMVLGVQNHEVAAGDSGWISLFDGKSLTGWTASEHKESCRVEDGLLVLGGERSHLFYNGPVGNHHFTDFELKLEVKTTPGSNSGVFFHTEYQETDWPKVGHEAQVNNSHVDWRRTGSLYAVKDLRESAAVDNEWFDYHIVVQGKQVTIKVNGETVNQFTETEATTAPADRPDRRFSSGTIALQAHDPGSTVYYRNIRIKLPTSDKPAPATVESGSAPATVVACEQCAPAPVATPVVTQPSCCCQCKKTHTRRRFRRRACVAR